MISVPGWGSAFLLLCAQPDAVRPGCAGRSVAADGRVGAEHQSARAASDGGAAAADCIRAPRLPQPCSESAPHPGLELIRHEI